MGHAVTRHFARNKVYNEVLIKELWGKVRKVIDY